MLEIKTRLKNIQKERNYTQVFVANKLGIYLQAYSKIESGETQLTIEKLNEIITILDIHPNQILEFDLQIDETFFKEEKKCNPNDSISLIQHY